MKQNRDRKYNNYRKLREKIKSKDGEREKYKKRKLKRERKKMNRERKKMNRERKKMREKGRK